jgi:hypothetical protein
MEDKQVKAELAKRLQEEEEDRAEVYAREEQERLMIIEEEQHKVSPFTLIMFHKSVPILSHIFESSECPNITKRWAYWTKPNSGYNGNGKGYS